MVDASDLNETHRVFSQGVFVNQDGSSHVQILSKDSVPDRVAIPNVVLKIHSPGAATCTVSTHQSEK